jgi:hypothetical protein
MNLNLSLVLQFLYALEQLYSHIKNVYEYFEPRGVVGEGYEVASVQVLKDNK